MVLNSWRFVIFFAAVFILYWVLPGRFRKYILLAANTAFCFSWGAQAALAVFAEGAVAYASGLLMEKHKEQKKQIRTLAVILCLAALFFFKYLNFALSTLESIASFFALPFHPAAKKLLMPIGISYYTLQAVGYICDVYRGRLPAERDAVSLLVFVSFFPQIMQGPISRAGDVLSQLREEHPFDAGKASYAVKLIAVGLFKKLVVADNLAPYVDRVYSSVQSYSGFVFILIQILYLFQLYGDFSGYSDIARGFAMLLGIDLPVNFESPYLSTTVGEFWSRWHMSLSSWLRDYVYIPLGGNRKGKARKCLNIMITFVVSGLWHGADWSYVLWGAINGFYQVAETVFHIRKLPLSSADRTGKKLRRRARALGVFALFGLAQFFFRASSVREALYIVSHLFTGITSPISYVSNGLLMNNWIGGGRLAFLIRLAVCVIPLTVYDLISERSDVISRITSLKKPVKVAVYLLIVALICFFRSVSGVSFVYFQF